jgi:hypothetical protein
MKPKASSAGIAPFLPVQFLLSHLAKGSISLLNLTLLLRSGLTERGRSEKAPCREVDETASRLKYLRNANAKSGAAVAAKGGIVVNLRRRNIFNGLLRVP